MATVHERFRDARFDYSAYPSPARPAAADVETELEEFRRFLEKRMAGGIGNVSVDAVLAEFRLYQDQLRELRESLRAQRERIERGEDTSIPWNKEAFLAELDRRLAAKGIVPDGPAQGPKRRTTCSVSSATWLKRP